MARNLSGRIITADSGEPLAFANVVTLSVADSSLIAGSVSDEDGLFKIPLPDDEKKEMFLRGSYIGYGVTDTPVTSDAMGDIVMTPS
ncbi:MAG: carboxypeptidase-like regulatory domain-containing protein, partial [Muribaculum sp.]|nr:carboxypeptidase-like regulatory domain-containing protein [Muribaculum sp.]